jgi:hypothetical protein
MNKKIKSIIKEYQCAGCVNGCGMESFEATEIKNDIACGKHCAGTMVSNAGRIFMGLPIGFNRLDDTHNLKITIFKTQSDQIEAWKYDKFNVPIWKYKGENGHTFVKGLMPRLTRPFIHIILDCPEFDEIDCIEITDKDIEEMD